eukprot:Selendium_serpulae@DN10121_c0_g1_i1.p1
MASKIVLDETVIDFVTSKDAHTRIAKISVIDGVIAVDETHDVGPDGLNKALLKVQDIVEDARPCFVLLRIEGRSNTPRWGVVVWITESSSFEEKSEYGRAREPLVEVLGNPYFVEEIFCSYKENLDAAVVRPKLSTTFRRRKVKTFDECERSFQGFITKDFHYRQRPFPPFPYNPGDGFNHTLNEFKKEKNNSCVVIALDDDASTVSAQKNRESSPSSVAQRLFQREPRFYLIRYADRIILFLSCLEGCTKSHRLQYASAKTTIVAMVEASGIEIWKTADVRIPSDLSESLYEDEMDTQFIPFANQKPRPRRKKKGCNLTQLYPQIAL